MCWNCIRAGDSISTAAAIANLLTSDNASGPQLCAKEIHTLGEDPVYKECMSVWKHTTQSSLFFHVPNLVCGDLQSRAWYLTA